MTCLKVGCERDAEYSCDSCDAPFCSDHGSKGGDRDGYDTVGAYAVPSQCWRCGGFDADA